MNLSDVLIIQKSVYFAKNVEGLNCWSNRLKRIPLSGRLWPIQSLANYLSVSSLTLFTLSVIVLSYIFSTEILSNYAHLVGQIPH